MDLQKILSFRILYFLHYGHFYASEYWNIENYQYEEMTRVKYFSLILCALIEILLIGSYLKRNAYEYNEEGRYFDKLDSVTYLEQSKIGILVLVILNAVIIMGLIIWIKKREQH